MGVACRTMKEQLEVLGSLVQHGSLMNLMSSYRVPDAFGMALLKPLSCSMLYPIVAYCSLAMPCLALLSLEFDFVMTILHHLHYCILRHVTS